MPADDPTDGLGNLREPSIRKPDRPEPPVHEWDDGGEPGDVRSLLEQIAEGVDRLAEQEQQLNTAEPDRAAADELLNQTLARLAEAVEKLAGEPEREPGPGEPGANTPDESPAPETSPVNTPELPEPPTAPDASPPEPPAAPEASLPESPTAPQTDPAAREDGATEGFDQIAALLNEMLEVQREGLDLQREANDRIERMAGQLNNFTIALAQQLLDRQVQATSPDDVWLG